MQLSADHPWHFDQFDSVIILDTETTGLNPDDQITEIAWVVLSDTLEVLDSQSSLIKPTIPIPPEVVEVTGISEEMLVDAPSLEEFMSLHQDRAPFVGTTLVMGHNIAFDTARVEMFFDEHWEICTWFLAQHAFLDLENHKLSTLIEELDVATSQDHRALNDVMMNREVLLGLLERVGCEPRDLPAYYHDLLVNCMMSLGKFKGTAVRDLPADYVIQMRELGFGQKWHHYSLDIHHPRLAHDADE